MRMQAPRVRGPPPCWYRHAPGLPTQAVAPMCSDPLPLWGPGSGAAEPGLKPTEVSFFLHPRHPPSCLPASYAGSSSVTRRRLVDQVGCWGGTPSPPPHGLTARGGEWGKSTGLPSHLAGISRCSIEHRCVQVYVKVFPTASPPFF